MVTRQHQLTALILIECSPINCRHVAVSINRDKLIERAVANHLSVDCAGLRNNNVYVEVGDTLGTTLCIAEVEFI